MFNSVVRFLLKLFELFGCIACLVIKNLTDQEARRIAVRNQKYSREWSLLNNVTWSREGNAFASVTYGGYTLITSLLLISRCIKLRAKPTVTEKTFLTVGMIFFFTIGSLVYASIEQVPSDLYDNAIILGTISYLVAVLFLIDLADPLEHSISHHTQTDNISTNQLSIQTQTHITSTEAFNEIKEFKKINNRLDITPVPSPDIKAIPHNGYYFAGDQVDIVQTKILPSPQEPVFAKILLPEKKRPVKEIIVQPTYLISKQENSKSKLYPKESRYRTDNNDGCRSQIEHQYQKYLNQDEKDTGRPIRLGFVAQAAKMWDRRTKHCNDKQRELSTIV